LSIPKISARNCEIHVASVERFVIGSANVGDRDTPAFRNNPQLLAAENLSHVFVHHFNIAGDSDRFLTSPMSRTTAL
jgi:hypothetical protein